MSKLRADAHWNRLSAEQRETLETWLFKENISYTEAVERMEKTFGIKSNIWKMGRFYQLLAKQRNEAELLQVIDEADGMDDRHLNLCRLNAYGMALVAKRMIRLGVESPGKVKEFAALARILIDHRAVQVKESWLELTLEKELKKVNEKLEQQLIWARTREGFLKSLVEQQAAKKKEAEEAERLKAERAEAKKAARAEAERVKAKEPTLGEPKSGRRTRMKYPERNTQLPKDPITQRSSKSQAPSSTKREPEPTDASESAIELEPVDAEAPKTGWMEGEEVELSGTGPAESEQAKDEESERTRLKRAGLEEVESEEVKLIRAEIEEAEAGLADAQGEEIKGAWRSKVRWLRGELERLEQAGTVQE